MHNLKCAFYITITHSRTQEGQCGHTHRPPSNVTSFCIKVSFLILYSVVSRIPLTFSSLWQVTCLSPSPCHSSHGYVWRDLAGCFVEYKTQNVERFRRDLSCVLAAVWKGPCQVPLCTVRVPLILFGHRRLGIGLGEQIQSRSLTASVRFMCWCLLDPRCSSCPQDGVGEGFYCQVIVLLFVVNMHFGVRYLGTVQMYRFSPVTPDVHTQWRVLLSVINYDFVIYLMLALYFLPMFNILP